MRKLTFCICENKNCKADQHLCFHYTDNTIPQLLNYKITNPAVAVAVQRGLCRTWSETTTVVF